MAFDWIREVCMRVEGGLEPRKLIQAKTTKVNSNVVHVDFRASALKMAKAA